MANFDIKPNFIHLCNERGFVHFDKKETLTFDVGDKDIRVVNFWELLESLHERAVTIVDNEDFENLALIPYKLDNVALLMELAIKQGETIEENTALIDTEKNIGIFRVHNAVNETETYRICHGSINIEIETRDNGWMQTVEAEFTSSTHWFDHIDYILGEVPYIQKSSGPQFIPVDKEPKASVETDIHDSNTIHASTVLDRPYAKPEQSERTPKVNPNDLKRLNLLRTILGENLDELNTLAEIVKDPETMEVPHRFIDLVNNLYNDTLTLTRELRQQSSSQRLHYQPVVIREETYEARQEALRYHNPSKRR